MYLSPVTVRFISIAKTRCILQENVRSVFYIQNKCLVASISLSAITTLGQRVEYGSILFTALELNKKNKQK